MTTVKQPTAAGGYFSQLIGVRSKEEVLAYEFPDLVDRIQKDMELPPDKAKVLFKDMLKFLYACGTHQSQRPFYPPLPIDGAWHTFLLFSKEYQVFCRENFSSFIHHAPLTPSNRAEHRHTKKTKIIPIARKLFGELSENWVHRAADCPQSCCPDYDCN
jgi:hypothetical protein